MVIATGSPNLKVRSLPFPDGRTHLAGFLDYLQAECGLALNTRKAYGRDLKRFLAEMSQQGLGSLSDLTPGHLDRYVRSLRQVGLGDSSSARAVAAVRMFCRYLVLQRVLAEDVSASILRPKTWHRLPTVLGEQAVQALLAAPQAADDAHALRDRALLMLLYATGIRATEAATLCINDVNFTLGVARVLGKGAKERIVPVADAALEALQNYMKQCRPALQPASQALFVSRSGRPLAREDVYRIVRKYVRRAGLRGRIGPHTLRHSFATEVLANGADLRSVQEMLGHADVASTQVYTHVDAARLKAVHKKYHPRP